MKIEKVSVGYLEENCYIVSIDNKCLVIDPGDEANKIIELIGGRKVEGILITHNHFDHIGALKEIKEKYNVEVYDHNNLKEGINTIGNFTFEVIYNPGHSKDSTSYYFKEEKIMFVGDFVFYRTVGRCDLDDGNIHEMKQSIEKLKQISEDITLYPGHGIETTLNEEKMYNPYF